MLPKYHILFGLIFSALIYLLFPQIGLFNATVIFLASVLIDVDHYLWYVYMKKDWSLKRAYKWFLIREKVWGRLTAKEKERYKRMTMAMHGFEFFLILFFFGIYVSDIFLFILMGVLLHFIVDIIDVYNKQEPYYIKLSPVYTLWVNKKKRILRYPA